MNTKKIVICAVIAALYALLTIILAPISYGPVQVRVSEAMCILPFFAPYTSWGLFGGCLIANVFNPAGAALPDIVIGSFSTLAAAFLTSLTKKKWLAPLPAVIVNALAVGAAEAWILGGGSGLFLVCASEILIGQAIACYCGGIPLMYLLERCRIKELLY